MALFGSKDADGGCDDEGLGLGGAVEAAQSKGFEDEGGLGRRSESGEDEGGGTMDGDSSA
jgi:hypothetical protein